MSPPRGLEYKTSQTFHNLYTIDLIPFLFLYYIYFEGNECDHYYGKSFFCHFFQNASWKNYFKIQDVYLR